MDEIKGYEIPIHRSLTEQILLGGVPRQIALLNGTLGAAMVIGLHSWIGIPICLFIHVIAVAATKKVFLASRKSSIRQLIFLAPSFP